MAWTPVTRINDNKLGGVTLKAAGAITTDTTSTAVEIGKGKFRVVTTWSTCTVAANDELYHVVLEANTRSATSTWYELQTLAVLGAYEANGRQSDNASTGSVETIVDNPLDYQVQVRTYVNGTEAGGCNFAVVAYPLGSKY